MSVIFLGRILVPDTTIPDKLPPSVYVSSWYINITNILIEQGEWNTDYRNGYIKMTFDNETDLENWVTTHALADPAILNDIKEWNTAYGVTHRNEIHDADGNITETSLTLTPF